MKYANKENTNVGETVSVPIHGESGHDEQICLKYEVVLALRKKVKPEEEIIGEGQEPMPEYLPFNDKTAFIK